MVIGHSVRVKPMSSDRADSIETVKPSRLSLSEGQLRLEGQLGSPLHSIHACSALPLVGNSLGVPVKYLH
jgi:hypothetical protein